MRGRKGSIGRLAGMPSMVTARRALGITKMYLAMTVFFMILATVAWNPGNFANRTNASASNSIAANASSLGSVASAAGAGSGGSLVLLAVPLYIVPLIMLTMPVLILFVYDKNNGMLEYMLSLGMSQKDIYTRYLNAALLMALVALAVFMPLNMAYSRMVYGPVTFAAILPVYPLAACLSVSIVAFTAMSMMAFSSLQKSRAGSNQPLGIAIGYAPTIPAYFALAMPLDTAIYFDIAIIAVVAIAAATLLLSSKKLIRRESLLP